MHWSSWLWLFGLGLQTAFSRAAEPVDLLVRGGTLVTMDPQGRVLSDSAVAIAGDRIVAVGPTAEVEARYEPKRTLDAAGRIVMPGLINAHGHAPMTLFRGLSDDRALMDWLRNYIFPAEAKFVDEAFVRAGTRLALLEMDLQGFFAAPEQVTYDRLTEAAVSGSFAAAFAVPLSIFFTLNILLFVFNLLPLPPLDGSALPPLFMSEKTAESYLAFLHQPQLALVGMMIAWKIFDPLFTPIIRFAINLLYPDVTYTFS